jgi:tetratricopeptide (TPR) repeat protein
MLLRTLTSWARGKFEIGGFDRAEALFREAIKCGEATSDLFWQGLALLGLGRVHHIRGEYERGRDRFEQALEIVRSEEFNHEDKKALEAQVHNYMGSAYRKLGDFQRSEQEYLEAISLAKELGDDSLFVAPLRNLGKHRFDLKRFDEAQALFEDCLQICIQWGKTDFVAGLEYLLAQIALQKGNECHALSLAEESLALFTKLGMKWQISGPQSLVNQLKGNSE